MQEKSGSPECLFKCPESVNLLANDFYKLNTKRVLSKLSMDSVLDCAVVYFLVMYIEYTSC